MIKQASMSSPDSPECREEKMLRDVLIDTAIKLRIDSQVRSVRAALFPIYRHDRTEGKFLHSLVSSVLAKDSNCIDIGAYRGRVLENLVRIAPSGKHIAYEPLPHAHQSLVERFPSVDVRLAAVSNETGEREFTYVKNMPARSGFRETSYPKHAAIQKLTVRVETLDNDLPAGYIPALIKIDVEGAERQVIEGGIKIIAKYKPLVIFEHGKGGAVYYDTQPRHIYELLQNEAGLRIFDPEGNGPYSLQQFEDSFALDARWDYVAY